MVKLIQTAYLRMNKKYSEFNSIIIWAFDIFSEVKWCVVKYGDHTQNVCSEFNPSKCSHTL